MKPRQIFSLVLGIVVLSLVALFGFFVFQSQVFSDFSEYKIAKQKWSNRPFSKYRLTVNSGHSLMSGCIYDVEVQDEKVLSKYPTDTCDPAEPRYTISGLFYWIMESEPYSHTNCASYYACGCLGDIRLISKYDMSLGYPTSIKREITDERKWLYPDYWMDLIGQKPCDPTLRSSTEDFFMLGSIEFEVKSLQPLP